MARRCIVASLAAWGCALVPSAAASAPEPGTRLPLEDAVAAALAANPGLLAGEREVRAREHGIRAAERKPNPELELEIENFLGTGSLGGTDAAEATLAVSKVWELGGKRASRIAEARAEREVAVRDADLHRMDVVTEVATAFYELLGAQERVELADSLTALAGEVLASVERRVRAGGVSPVEARRARVSLETARVDRERTLRLQEIARARLAATWGGRPEFHSAAGRLDAFDPAVPSLETLRERLSASPWAARWTAETERRIAVRDRAASGRTPDLTLRGGVRRLGEAGETGLVFGVGLPLPLLDPGTDARSAAEERIAQADAERREGESRMDLALATTHARLTAAVREAAALRDRILPEAEAALAESRIAYERGRLRLTDVLDAERSAFELHGRYVDVLVDYHLQTAELDRLLGAPRFLRRGDDR